MSQVGQEQARGRGERRGSRIADPERLQAAFGDLEHLDLQHDLRLGNVQRGDQLFRHAHGIGRVAHDDQVGPLVDEQRLRPEHRLQHRLGVLGRGVREIERADDLLLVILLFGRIVRVDEHHVGGEDLPRERVLIEHQVDGLLHRHILHEDRGLAVALDVLVEDEVDAGLALQDLEHHLGRCVAQLQSHLAVVAGLQSRRDRNRSASDIELRRKLLRRRVSRILVEDRAQLCLRRVIVLAIEVLACLGDHVPVMGVTLQPREAVLRPVIVGIEGEHTPVTLGGAVELVRRAGGIRERDQLLYRSLAPRFEIEPVAHVVRIAMRRLGEQCYPALVLPLVDCRETVAMQTFGRAARQSENQNHAGKSAP